MSEQKKLLSELTTLEKTDVQDALISGLRARPNATSIYGAPGMTANELKKQYDKYPEILRAKLNELIEVLKERFTVDENGITPVANDIYVKMADDTIATLSRAIEELDSTDRAMSFDISQSLVNADNALQTAERASTVAEEAHSFAAGAMSLSDTALGIANESKEIASDAYSYARTAEQDSYQAKSLAENAESLAKDARKEAEDASSIAKGANQAKTFDTKKQMESYVKGLYGFYVGQELKAGSTIIMSQGGHIEEIEYGRIICDFTLVATNANTGEQSTIFEETYADCTGEINGKYYSLYTVPFDLIVDYFFGSFYMYNGFDSSYFDGARRFAAIERAESDLNTYLLEKLTESIIPIGTNLYIRDVGVPDYWWDGGKAQELETQKVDLTEYADKDFVAENYVKKETGNKMGVYVHDYDSATGRYVDKILKYSSSAGPNKWFFVQRDGDGLIQTASPIKDLHVANKSYVDQQVEHRFLNIVDEVQYLNSRIDELEARLAALGG